MISNVRNAVAAVLTLSLMVGCGPEKLSKEQKFDAARDLTQNRYMDDGYRAQAMGYWRELDEDRASLTAEQKQWVDFGIGILTMVDMVQGVQDLLQELISGSDEGSEDEASSDATEESAITGEVAAKLVTGIRDNFLQTELVERFERVLAANPNFEAEFACRDGQVDCMLVGNLDSGEILLFTGLLGVTSSLLEQLTAREGLIEFALDTAMDPPALDESQNLFRQLPELAYATLDTYARAHYQKGFADSPMFELKSGSATLSEQQGAMVKYLTMLRDGFKATEGDDSESGEVFDRDNYIGDILTEFVGLEDLGLADIVIDSISVTELREELDGVVASFAATSTDAAGAYYFPALYADLKGLAGDLLPDPSDAHIPSVWLGGLFTADKADWKTGLLPRFDASDGAFYAQWEQEPYEYDVDKLLGPARYKDVGVEGVPYAFDLTTMLNDGSVATFGADNDDFDSEVAKREAGDVIPPLGHYDPDGNLERPNGYVNPMYLFWSDGSFAGMLAPTVNVGTGDDPVYAANPAEQYANRNLNGLVSALLSLIAGL